LGGANCFIVNLTQVGNDTASRLAYRHLTTTKQKSLKSNKQNLKLT
jgi:hypothetical protein